MQNQRNTLTVLLTSTLIFGLLFHHKALGLNLVIFEALMLSWLLFTKQFTFQTKLERIMIVAQVLTLVFTVLHHSIWSFVIHFLICFLLVGTMIAPQIRSIVFTFGASISNAFLCFHELFVRPETVQKTKNDSKRKYRFKRLRLYIIPLLIILVFASLYGWANPEFGKYVNKVMGRIYDFFALLLESIDFFFIATLFFGFLITIFVLKRGENSQISEVDARYSDEKIRRRDNIHFIKTLALKNEYRSGIFLFSALNLLLLVMNFMDLDHVWLHFEWEGQYLRQFVHEGTIILLVAIFLSVVLVLRFFRNNLNFYSKNKPLKVLCYVWLAQNAFLAVSAGIRNYYYIQYYSLAYKRIAIIFFLILAIYGLFTVYLKVKNTKSSYFIVRKNAFAWLMVFIISAGFNWDRIIAEYNFTRDRNAFVHFNFLANLSDTALPALEQPMEKLKKIDNFQEHSFFSKSVFKSGFYRNAYMTPLQYKMNIEWKKSVFKRRWEQKSWLEWNWAESRAYEELKEAKAF